MATYIISYDNSGEEYESLHNSIKSYSTWAHITESTWAVATTQSASQVRDKVGKHLPSGSRLFVVKSGVEAAWRNVICKSEWLKNNL